VIRHRNTSLYTLLAALCAGLLLPALASAQSSQASLQGQVINQASGEPIARALVIQRNLLTNAQGYRYTNEQGYFSFPALQPGTYTVRVDALGFQPEERSPVELPVASRIELNFALIRNAGQIQTQLSPSPAPRAGENPRSILAVMYGADAAVPQAVLVRLPVSQIETLIGSISSLIDENKILELPLGGRDVYTLLVLQPNVTSDNATARGLGFSVNGQQASSSNYLLDGVDNNDLQVTGPATKVSADVVKEYRMSTNNFTAEYGRNAGFIANAITRSGTNQIHGSLFEFTGHDQLNANSFSNNWQGLRREPFVQNQFGGTVGGPLRRDRIFFFGGYERSEADTASQPQPFLFPSPALLAIASPNSIARKLLTEFPAPDGDPVPGNPFATVKKMRQPLPQDSDYAFGRTDHSSPDGRTRLSARYAFSQNTQEDFVFSPYPGLNSPLVIRGQNLGLSYIREAYGGTNEMKFGYSRNSVNVLRPHAEIPSMESPNDGILLPGSAAGYDYAFRDSVFHLIDNYSHLRGSHAFVMGFEWRPYLHDSLFSAGRDGLYKFLGIGDFAFDVPAFLQITMNRQTGRPAADADFWRYYFQNEMAAFFQDNWKLSRRLTLNLGLRWEFFGVPSPRRDKQDFNFVFGPGATVPQRIASGTIQTGALFGPDRNNFAPRFGFAYDLTGSGRSVLRGGYGIYFDRIFNNFWEDTRANNLSFQTYGNLTTPPQFQYAIPARNGVAGSITPGIGEDVAVDRSLRTPYVQSWFVGLQQQLTPNLILEVNHTGALGRKLASSDVINRSFSTPISFENINGRFNAAEPDISYRSNQGVSNHVALQIALSQRLSRGIQFQVSYTVARSRDVQSNPLTRPGDTSSDPTKKLSANSLFRTGGSFTRQFDPSYDYGHSDFDQRQNLVFNFTAPIPPEIGLPKFFSGWEASGLAGFRSGFPFTAYATLPSDANIFQAANLRFIEPGNGLLFAGGASNQNRADYWGSGPSDAFLANPRAIPGGLLVLNALKFGSPRSNQLGGSSRNSFFGPGFWNFDLALNRRFLIPRLGERVSLQFRAELFNVFNHTNLSSPIETRLEYQGFGDSFYGRQGAGASGVGASSPASSPLSDQPRHIQFALKLYF
jgi:carboxypeptidase family protein